MSLMIIESVIPLALIITSIVVTALAILSGRTQGKDHIWQMTALFVSLAALVIITIWPSATYGPVLGLLALTSAFGANTLRRKLFDEPDEVEPDETEQDQVMDHSEMQRKILLFSVFNNLQDLVLIVNSDGIVAFMNRVAVNKLGDQIGMTCSQILACEQEQCLSCRIKKGDRESSRPEVFEHKLNGHTYEIAMNAIHGDPEGLVILIMRDRTKRKALERQVVTNEKMVALGQLVAGVAHEINNPITFVASNVEYFELIQKMLNEYINMLEKAMNEAYATAPPEIAKIIENVKKWEEEKDFTEKLNELPSLLEDINDGVDRVKKIVADLKDFSHQGTEQKDHADVNAILKQTIRIAHNQLKKNITVVANYDESVNAIPCWPQQLKQVFLNLVVNAAGAMKNEEEGVLSIESKVSDDFLNIRISDNGPGMSDEVKQRIFEPFFTTKEVGDGTGLGLSIAYSIIERHQGEMSVESVEGKGASFIVKLPIPTDSEKQKNRPSIIS